MRLRKAWLTRLAALLEAGAETPEELAQDFADALADLQAQESWWYAVAQVSGVGMIVGPYPTVLKAKTEGAKVGPDKLYLMSGYTAEGLRRVLTEVDIPPERKAKNEKFDWARFRAAADKEVASITAISVKRVQLP